MTDERDGRQKCEERVREEAVSASWVCAMGGTEDGRTRLSWPSACTGFVNMLMVGPAVLLQEALSE